MTEPRLKELLDEVAATVPSPDQRAITAAWTTARRRQRRRTALGAAGTVAVLVVGVGVFANYGTPKESAPPPTAPATSFPTTPITSSEPDGTYAGTPVWWAPEADAEAALPWATSPFPRAIDLSADRPRLEPGQPALGVFPIVSAEKATPVRFVVLSPDGATSELPARQIVANVDKFGNTAALTPSNGGLSPDGWHLAMAQPNSLELYDFATGTWRTVPAQAWVAERARWLDADTLWVPGTPASQRGSTYDVEGQLIQSDVKHVDPELAVTTGDEAYGVWVDGPGALAGSYYLQGPVTGGSYSNPEGLIAQTRGHISVLALSLDGRFKGCCPVVGWLSQGLLAFASGNRILGWQVETGSVVQLADLSGLDTAKEAVRPSWAWQALR